ncbi:hypothetical protein [Variovorax saccharolyticus]|uniref:hypothetical protein n=1 Tax=Variovorax saccharolyticus TaxID=3053516 RepID=UPI00257556DE|nr:hypothetical protein [Variovorax sp. J31P216]MDM0027415.1 hypothetical protein [Variovorax sp. J31P216]
MPIDRRTFVLGSGAASAVGAFAAFGTLAAAGAAAPPAAALPAVAAGASPALRILGWNPGEAQPEAAAWIAIDTQWRAAWH